MRATSHRPSGRWTKIPVGDFSALLGGQQVGCVAERLGDALARHLRESHLLGAQPLDRLAIDIECGQQSKGLPARGLRLLPRRKEIVHGRFGDGRKLLLLLRRRVELDRQVLRPAVDPFVDLRRTERPAAPPAAAQKPVMPSAHEARMPAVAVGERRSEHPNGQPRGEREHDKEAVITCRRLKAFSCRPKW